MRKNKYNNKKSPNRACDTEFSQFRSLLAKVEYELEQKEKEKKKERERNQFKKRHKRDDDHTEDLREVK